MSSRTQLKAVSQLPTWDAGDQVMYLKLGKKTHALEPKCTGPYSIVEHLSPLVYRIEKDGQFKWVHVPQLKLFS